MAVRAPDHKRLGAASIALLLCFLLPGLLLAKPKTVEFPSADGHQLTGTLWGDGEGPGVLLLHQCNSSRSMYEELGGKLAQAGFEVLAIDFRGFGDSRGNGLDFGKAERDDKLEMMSSFPQDAEAAYQYLAQQGAGQVQAALGASCGGWQLVGLGQAHPELTRLGFFSSGLKAEHERDLLRMTGREYLFVVAKGDVSAVGPAGTLAYRAKERTELLLYDGDAHGYPLFEQDPELADKIVAFYRPLLE